MNRYKVFYEGYYIVEAETIDEALETSRDDEEVELEEWVNTEAEKFD